MKYFEHEYLIPGDIFYNEGTLCMRCGTPICKLDYKEMKKHNDPTQLVNVAYVRKLPNYREVKYHVQYRGARGVTYLLLCKECKDCELSEEDKKNAVWQITKAKETVLKWIGKEVALEAKELEFLNQQQILGRV